MSTMSTMSTSTNRQTPIYVPSTEFKGMYLFNLEMEKLEDAVIWGVDSETFKKLELKINPTLCGYISFVRKFINNPNYQIEWIKRNKNEN